MSQATLPGNDTFASLAVSSNGQTFAAGTIGSVELRRVEYPVEETVRTVEESTLPEPAKARLVEVFRNGGIRHAGAAS